MLIRSAFHVKDSQISGGPAWLDAERYDIVARRERADISDDNLWYSLQPQLAERFQLRFHREIKEMPVYSLVVAKGGPRLKNHKGDDQPILRFTAGSGGMGAEPSGRSLAIHAGLAARRSGNNGPVSVHGSARATGAELQPAKGPVGILGVEKASAN